MWPGLVGSGLVPGLMSGLCWLRVTMVRRRIAAAIAALGGAAVVVVAVETCGTMGRGVRRIRAAHVTAVAVVGGSRAVVVAADLVGAAVVGSRFRRTCGRVVGCSALSALCC